jgi:hypothetical protein
MRHKAIRNSCYLWDNISCNVLDCTIYFWSIMGDTIEITIWE